VFVSKARSRRLVSLCIRQGNEAVDPGTTPQPQRAKQRATYEGKEKEMKDGGRGIRVEKLNKKSLIFIY
jgi:hypothetical protein